MDYDHHDMLVHPTSKQSKQADMKSEAAPETRKWEQVSRYPTSEMQKQAFARTRRADGKMKLQARLEYRQYLRTQKRLTQDRLWA